MRLCPQKTISVLYLIISFFVLPLCSHAAAPLGIFQGHSDVGKVLHPGSAIYDPVSNTYTVSGSGENMWFGRDDFHFVWTKVSGDVALTANITFLGATGNNHRKAVLMIRQTLDDNSKSVDVARHGNGLTSLQYRDDIGADTHEVESNISAPRTVSIQKRGDYVYAFVSGRDGKLQPAGASTKVTLRGEYYIGIGVCSHDKDVTEKAVFSKLTLSHLAKKETSKFTLYSALETITIASTDRLVRYVVPAQIEAPNWSKDGSFLLFNSEGRLQRLNLDTDQPQLLSTDSNTRCNNDHGISPDGRSIAFSDQSVAGEGSSIYLMPIAGGSPKRITQQHPSYWHGWSPDGKTIAFMGERNGNFDIFTTSVTGGPETRLTTAEGLDDGPEYSPDGAYIYFNSERTGSMQIWRMKSDGSEQEQVLVTETNDWFPHLSPDGRWMVFLSYDKAVIGHPAQKDVTLNLMSMKNKKVHVLAELLGGQGTINVPSWSPDSLKLAFVSYELIPGTAD